MESPDADQNSGAYARRAPKAVESAGTVARSSTSAAQASELSTGGYVSPATDSEATSRARGSCRQAALDLHLAVCRRPHRDVGQVSLAPSGC